MNIISKLLNKEITSNLYKYLNVHRAYSNLPINIWLITKTQSPNKFFIVITNSYNANPTRDGQLMVIELDTNKDNLSSKYIYETIAKNSKFSIGIIDNIVKFIMTNIDIIINYYLEINNRTETLSNIIAI